MSETKKIHYSGGLRIVKAHKVVTLAPGYPVCCVGVKAEAIRKQGYQSTDINNVTCRKCLSKYKTAEA